MEVHFTHIDTACFLLEVGSYRILTDPAFDASGKIYHFGFGTFSKKYSNPSIALKNLGKIDLILLSHDQHNDNLDHSGRKYLSEVSNVISTVPASRRLSGVTGLNDWQSIQIENPHVKGLKITAVPAQHAAFRFMVPLAGKVIGFIVEWEGQEDGVYYISGDTVLFSGIYEIAKRFQKIDTAFLHMGSVAFPYLSGPLRYTFNSKEAVRAIEILRPKISIPVHCEGWWHFRERVSDVKKNFDQAQVSSKVRWCISGKREKLSS